MNIFILIIFVLVFFIRLFFLKKSKQNEAQILKNGGREYGKMNSRLMAILHTFFYLICLIEAVIRKPPFDGVSFTGFILLMFSMIMLFYVSHLLSPIWTVKLMIAKNHPYVEHFLFKTFRHPNYYLNIIPELIGLALLCHAFFSFVFLFPFYVVVLIIRIREEEKLITEFIKK